MALILHIETGTEICSVALSDGAELISLKESDSGRDHATKLGVFVDEILRENNLSAADLSAVSVSMGPGSYTGLRIGVSLAKGLCYSLKIPLIGVSSLDSLVNIAKDSCERGEFTLENWDRALLCPMIDARRMEVYTRIFDGSLNPVTELCAEIITKDSFADQLATCDEFVVFGNGAEKSLSVLDDSKVVFVDVKPSAKGLVKSAYDRFQSEDYEDIAYFEPMYLKDFLVQKSTKKLF